MRIGHGYDLHLLKENRRLILCGVDIPFEKGLDGHSDADVAAHAVIDALLGAAALGDIGGHFPDSDPAYEGADSLALLAQVVDELHEKGRVIQNVDVTLLAQRPKLAPYIPQMRENLAAACGIETDMVSVKATTEEGANATGGGQAISAFACALIE